MEILLILERELVFVERFYTRTAEPFEAIHRKIGAQEEPFFSAETHAEDGEPEYLDEWLEADEILRVLGLSALMLVEKALHNYLRRFAMRELDVAREKDLSTKLDKLKKEGRLTGDGWLNKYFSFLQDRGLVLSESPVALAKLEQITLTRNDIAHGQIFDGLTTPTRGEKHFEKYPDPTFADELEVMMLEASDVLSTDIKVRPIFIKVSRETLRNAMQDVRAFCSYVEARRTI